MPRGLIQPREVRTKMSPSHARAPQQEREAAKRLGGSVTRGSGNGLVKGDVRKRGVFRIECKTTKHQSFSVTREMIEKIEAAALAGGGEIPAMEIEFHNEGKPMMSVAVVPLWALEMIGEVRQQ